MIKKVTLGEKIFLEVYKYDIYNLLVDENICIKDMDIKTPSEWFNDMSNLFVSDQLIVDKIFNLAANKVMSLDELTLKKIEDFGHNKESYGYILNKINLSLQYFYSYIIDQNNTEQNKKDICISGLKALRMGSKDAIMELIA